MLILAELITFVELEPPATRESGKIWLIVRVVAVRREVGGRGRTTLRACEEREDEPERRISATTREI